VDRRARISTELFVTGAIAERIFDLFEIHSSRQLILDFYDRIGRVEPDADEASAEAQAAIE